MKKPLRLGKLGNIDPLGIAAISRARDLDGVIKVLRDKQVSLQAVRDLTTLHELNEIAKKISTGKERGFEVLDEYVTKFDQASRVDGVVNGRTVEESVTGPEQKLVLRLREQLIEEYEVKSVSELMLIDIAINAYFRNLQSSRVFSDLREKSKNMDFGQLKINLMKVLERQIDISSKQYLSSVTMLKELKQPPIHIKVSGSAYVGQNQQFNKNA